MASLWKFYMISNSFFNSIISCQSDFWRSSRKCSLQASMEARLIWKFKLEVRSFHEFFGNNKILFYLADQNITLFEMATDHFWRFPRDRLDFDADLLALASLVDFFVVELNTCHDSNVQELKNKQMSRSQNKLANSIYSLLWRGHRSGCPPEGPRPRP